jgi:hypothetical protein
MNNYTIIFKDRNSYQDVELVADQINESGNYTAFVSFTTDGAEEYSCVRFATDVIFSINETPVADA